MDEPLFIKIEPTESEEGWENSKLEAREVDIKCLADLIRKEHNYFRVDHQTVNRNYELQIKSIWGPSATLEVHSTKRTFRKKHPCLCTVCNTMLDNSRDVIVDHVNLHIMENRSFGCATCEYVSTQLDLVVDHLEKQQVVDTRASLPTCNLCNLRTYDLRRHLEVHHVRPIWKCTRCTFETTTERALFCHLRTYIVNATC